MKHVIFPYSSDTSFINRLEKSTLWSEEDKRRFKQITQEAIVRSAKTICPCNYAMGTDRTWNKGRR